jgi:hypothetical protein
VTANYSQELRLNVFRHTLRKSVYPGFDSSEDANPERLVHVPAERSAIVPDIPEVINRMPVSRRRITEPRLSWRSASG